MLFDSGLSSLTVATALGSLSNDDPHGPSTHSGGGPWLSPVIHPIPAVANGRRTKNRIAMLEKASLTPLETPVPGSRGPPSIATTAIVATKNMTSPALMPRPAEPCAGPQRYRFATRRDTHDQGQRDYQNQSGPSAHRTNGLMRPAKVNFENATHVAANDDTAHQSEVGRARADAA